MKTTIVSSATLAGHGRWDARYHLLAAEHGPLAAELFDRFDAAGLAALAADLPFDKAAADAVFPRVHGLDRAAFLEILQGKKPPKDEEEWKTRRPVPVRSLQAVTRRRQLAVYCAAAAFRSPYELRERLLELSRLKLSLIKQYQTAVSQAEAAGSSLLAAALRGKKPISPSE